MSELHSSNGKKKDQQHVNNTRRHECSAQPCRQRRSPSRKMHLTPSPDGKTQPHNQECRRGQYHPPPPSLRAGGRNYAHRGKAHSRDQTGDRTDRRSNEDGSHSTTLNAEVSDGWPSTNSRTRQGRGGPAIRSTVLLADLVSLSAPDDHIPLNQLCDLPQLDKSCRHDDVRMAREAVLESANSG